MSSQKGLHENHTLLDRFDDVLDDFHHWLKDIQDRREQNITELETSDLQDLQELSEEVAQVEGDKDHVSLVKSDMRKFWIIGGITALASYFFFQSLDLLYLIITGIIVSMASEKIIRFFQIRLPRGLSIALAYICILLFLFGGVVLVIPFLIQQTAELISLLIDWALVMQTTLQNQGLASVVQGTILPQSIKDAILTNLAGSNIQQSLQSTLVENISQIVTMGSSYIKNAGDFAVTLFTNTFSGLFQIAIVFTVAVFGSLEKEGVTKFISSLSSTPHHTEKEVSGLYDKLGNWLLGQVLLSLTVGLMVGLGLVILNWLGLGLPSSFTLALIAGLTEFIPYLGPILGAVPGIFVASLAYGFKGFIAAGILYSVVQWTENNILVPLIMSQTLGVSPMLIFVMMLILGSLLGLLGVIIAVPITVIVNVMYKQYLKRVSLKEKEFSS